MTTKIITFGCRLNTYESELIKQEIQKLNLKDDVILFNSCAVTNEAERQLKQAIRKARREDGKAKIIVTGCASQIYPEKYATMEEVDLVVGNKEKPELVRNLNEYFGRANCGEKVIVSDIQEHSNYFKEFSSTLYDYDNMDRAFVQIQNGCNHRCTYCIIPYGRGKSTSILSANIVEQIREFCKNGFNEVVLTGVDITEYGADLDEGLTLGKLIKLILAEIPELPRLRLSSVDVAEIDAELLELIYNEKRLMPHLHISLQAGDNMILKRMMRRHTREDVIEFCKDVAEKRDGIAFGCDIIAGFPTETDEMFQNSLKIIEEANLVYTHIFPYSIREGTPAGKMQQVDGGVRRERARMLREAGEKQLSKFMDRFVGTVQSVLVESNNVGRMENFLAVRLPEDCGLKAGGELVF
jgi:threonylcarbamoyladenosine tRNA methylthiotransferase MtaB